ncbi:SET domain [Carpediemonas membranifera]|uniref:SET domain n=1 Tax=Carpediemonas membranifera TaxID=201153 RepID=A0A8J6E283_9EUKA|nr:SET domain [Carpediemonas membranifera]|eukprot:KAG9394001.1 SET domain [Carpediemonas membranifera]
MDDYVDWMQERSFNLIPEIEVSTRTVSGLGVISKKSISKDTTVGRIPADAILCYQNSDLRSIIEEHIETLVTEDSGDWVPLALSFIRELYFQPDSAWKPYLATLPAPTTKWLPFHWTEDELETLSGTDLLGDIRDNQQRIAATYATVVQPFTASHTDFFPKPVTLPMFQHACYIIMSYSFTHESWGTVLAPFGDTFNHKTAGNTVSVTQAGDGFDVVACADIGAGQELWNTYGDLDTANLLMKYGFVEKETNPFDIVRVTGDQLAEACPQVADADPEFLEEYLELTDGVDLGDIDLPIHYDPAADAIYAEEILVLLGSALGMDEISPDWPPEEPRIREACGKLLELRLGQLGSPRGRGAAIVECERRVLDMAKRQLM